MRRPSLSIVVAIFALVIASGCGTTTVKTVTTTAAPPAVPTAAQLKTAEAEQKAKKRTEEQEKRAEEVKEKQEHAHEAAEQRATAGREHHEREAETQTFSGNGGRNLGTITVAKESTINWTNDGAYFGIYSDAAIPVNSSGHSGSSVLEAGRYTKFQVNAVGNWTMTIVPK